MYLSSYGGKCPSVAGSSQIFYKMIESRGWTLWVRADYGFTEARCSQSKDSISDYSSWTFPRLTRRYKGIIADPKIIKILTTEESSIKLRCIDYTKATESALPMYSDSNFSQQILNFHDSLVSRTTGEPNV